MAMRKSLALMFSLIAIAASAVIAFGVIWALNTGMEHFWPQRGMATRLVLALIAPWGVVLFGYLLEHVGKVAEHVARPAR
jgi:hypothetical protein